MDFVFILKAIVMAIVEGITEFIPVSSSGHMILVGHAIGFTGKFANMFEVVIQLGAILAIVVLYWNKLWGSFIKLFKGDKKALTFWINIIIGIIPIGILGLKFDDVIDEYLFSPVTVAIGLFVGGLLLFFVEKKYRRKAKVRDVDGIKGKQAAITGLFQCLSLWPGMSRSSSTIIGGWISGVSTVAATEFSFFLAIPAMIGASGYKGIKYLKYNSMNSTEIVALTVGFIVAFLVSIVVVEKFINFLKKKPMRIFAVYRIVVGAIILILTLFGVVKF